MKPINKKELQSLNIDGYTWSGFFNKMHTFTKKEKSGCYIIKCNTTDIKNGNIIDLINMGLSR